MVVIPWYNDGKSWSISIILQIKYNPTMKKCIQITFAVYNPLLLWCSTVMVSVSQFTFTLIYIHWYLYGTCICKELCQYHV